MSKYLSGIKNRNIHVNSSGITSINIPNNISGNVSNTPDVITSNTTLTTDNGNSFIILNPNNVMILNLPTEPIVGQQYKIINTSQWVVTISTNNMSINFDGRGFNTILLSQYDKLNIIYYNNNWFTM